MSPARASAPKTERRNIHGTGLVLGRTGIVLRGPSGAGKSLLALELLDRWQAQGRKAVLVADDRLEVSLEGKAGALRPIMHAPPNIAGLIELRGLGIVTRPHVQSAPVHLVVDLVDDLVRLIEEDELETDLLGEMLPRCPVPRRGIVDSAHQLLLIGEALRGLKEPNTEGRRKTG